MASFYKGPAEEPAAATPGPERQRPPTLTDADPVFKSEFNTIGYLAIGFSLIALLLIGIIFFRPPKPEDDLRALAEAQTQTRQSLERLAGQVASLDRRVDKTDEGDLVRSLKITLLALDELEERGSPHIKTEAEGLQAKIEALLGELEGGSGSGSSP